MSTKQRPVQNRVRKEAYEANVIDPLDRTNFDNDDDNGRPSLPIIHHPRYDQIDLAELFASAIWEASGIQIYQAQLLAATNKIREYLVRVFPYYEPIIPLDPDFHPMFPPGLAKDMVQRGIKYVVGELVEEFALAIGVPVVPDEDGFKKIIGKVMQTLAEVGVVRFVFRWEVTDLLLERAVVDDAIEVNFGTDALSDFMLLLSQRLSSDEEFAQEFDTLRDSFANAHRFMVENQGVFE